MGLNSVSSSVWRAAACWIAGAIALWLAAGTALAEPAFLLNRASSAPEGPADLTMYAMQFEDTTGVDIDPTYDPTINPNQSTGPDEGSLKSAVDSITGMSAPLETLAPLPTSIPPVAPAAEPPPPLPTRRPLFGLSNIVLIAGLVALHVVVVSLVAK